MMATVPHVTSGLGLRKFQADGILLTRVYKMAQLVEALHYKPEGRRSISHGISGMFHYLHPSSSTMNLGSTQPLTEMSTRSISWGLRVALA